MKLTYTATYRDPLTQSTFTRAFVAYNRKRAYSAADEYADQMDCDMVSFKLTKRG